MAGRVLTAPRRERIAAAIGAESVRALGDGTLYVTPSTTDAMAGLLGMAYDEGWRVGITGAGTWQQEPPQADLIVSTRGLDDSTMITFAGGRVTVPAGVGCDTFRQLVAEHGAWLPLDPPGRPSRTVGSVIATGTAGPLRTGFGPIRDQVVALTVVSANGRVIRGASEMASEPSVRPHIGGFGGFGVITEVTFDLQPIPLAERSWVARGSRDQLSAAARDFATLGVQAVAAELISPALATESTWLLAVRATGSPELLAEQADRLDQLAGLQWQELAPDRRALVWDGSARGHTTLPLTVRIGVLPEGIDEAIDLIVDHVGEGMLSAGVVAGMIRWSGHATPESLRVLRAEFSARESPLTIERGPWELLRRIGHTGSYREGADGPIERLRNMHDPRAILVTAITSEVSA